MPNLADKRILMIIPYQDFNDQEFKIPRDRFCMLGAEVLVASSSIGTATSKTNWGVETDYLLEDIKTEDYDAIIFVGGMGSVALQNNDEAHRIARGAFSNNKILGAICIAPIILAKSGVLVNKKATVWTDSDDKTTVEELKKCKVNYIDQNIVVDKKIITANGPDQSTQFAETIIDLLDKN